VRHSHTHNTHNTHNTHTCINPRGCNTCSGACFHSAPLSLVRFVLKGFANDGRDLTDKETKEFLRAADKDGDGKIGVDGKHCRLSGSAMRSHTHTHIIITRPIKGPSTNDRGREGQTLGRDGERNERCILFISHHHPSLNKPTGAQAAALQVYTLVERKIEPNMRDIKG